MFHATGRAVAGSAPPGTTGRRAGFPGGEAEVSERPSRPSILRSIRRFGTGPTQAERVTPGGAAGWASGPPLGESASPGRAFQRERGRVAKVSEAGPVRVLVADDMTLVREGFVEILAAAPGFEVVGQAGTGEAAIDLYRRLRPDVLLLDLKMPPGPGGVEVMRAVRAVDGRARVLVLTVYDGDQDIARALAAGAAGYLLKTVGRPEFLAAVQDVARGLSVIPPEVAGRVAAHLTSERLTGREVEVLRQIADGKANKEIAHALGISEGTVKSHVINILDKLDCWGRVEAVAVATRRGYLR